MEVYSVQGLMDSIKTTAHLLVILVIYYKDLIVECVQLTKVGVKEIQYV